jgi:hypothetical protein
MKRSVMIWMYFSPDVTMIQAEHVTCIRRPRVFAQFEKEEGRERKTL